MKRRQFLTTALQAGIAANCLGIAEAQNGHETGVRSEVTGSLPKGMVGQEAMAGYFSEQQLIKGLGTAELHKPKDVQVVAFNFPSWHPSPYMEKHFGKGWTEFDTLKNSRSLFPGHSMPHYPLWGYYDESDPHWAAQEIELASTYGVDAWMIDWYWHSGVQFYHEQLEQGFLKAENRAKLKFAVMWANHDWKNVYPARSPKEAAVLLPQIHTIADFGNVLNYCAEHYFSQPNYLRLNDAPVFGLFTAGKVIEQIGIDGLRHGLELMRERGQKLGFPKLHLQVCNGSSGHDKQLRDFGFDSATLYGTFGWTYGSKPPASRIPYGIGASEAITAWKTTRENIDVPFFPSCSVGWDDSPRFEDFACVAINRSPDQFERLVRAARHFVASDSHEKLIYIAAWNEWTEDHVLLPDTYWGYSYLEALRRAVKS